MIYRNKRDQEAWLREKSLESLKANTFLQENDIVQVAENSNFYKVVTTTTPIPLQNELFAQAMPSELAGNIETASKLKTPAKIELTGDALGSVMFDGSENVKLTVEVLDDSHTHNTQYNTKAEITEIKTALENKDTQLTQEINTAKQDISNLKTSDAKKANSNINITAGKGLTGGGDLTANRNFDIVSANEGILVNADNIELNVVDDLITGGAKRPLSAEQGKVLKQLLDTMGTGGTSQLFRNARTLGDFDLVGQLTANAKSITAGKRLYKPVLYLDGTRIDKNMYDINLDNGLITLKQPYSKYETTWVIEDEYPFYIKLSYPTLNLLSNDDSVKNEIQIGDIIEIQGESESGDGGHRLVKCENTAKLNAVNIGSSKYLNEIPNTKGTSFWTKNNFDPSTKADKTHEHPNYQPKGEYAALNHNHDSVYQKKGDYSLVTHTHEDLKQSITEVNSFFDLYSANKRYIVVNGDAGVKVLKNTIIKVGEKVFKVNSDVVLTAANLDTGSFAVGKDYYIYCCNKSNSAEFKISLNSTYPNGYTADNSRKIGGFHYGDCRRIKENTLEPINKSGVAWGAGWEDNVYVGILPFSVWTILFRPISEPEGMVFDESISKWVDIYNCNTSFKSEYNKTPMTGSEGLMYYDWYEKVARKTKKFPLSYPEFCSVADGSPNGRDEDNNYAWTKTTNSVRNKTGVIAKAVSSIGCKDCVGNVWEVGTEYSWTTNGSWAWRNQANIKKGAIYSGNDYDPRLSLHGGNWSFGSSCGSRTLDCYSCPWHVNSGVGCRLASASL